MAVCQPLRAVPGPAVQFSLAGNRVAKVDRHGHSEYCSAALVGGIFALQGSCVVALYTVFGS